MPKTPAINGEEGVMIETLDDPPGKKCGRWLAVHPGAAAGEKRLPEKTWEELLRHLIRETAFNLLLVAAR